MGGKTTNEEVTVLGFGTGEYKAEDSSGHTGYGFSKEQAQQALEKAQAHDTKGATVGGWFDSDGTPLDDGD
jgi:hypothetical protein